MLNIEINEEFSKTLVNDVVERLVPILLQELKQNELPHLLTRKQFMELVDIGESKCNELFHRRDFPVNRELGQDRKSTRLNSSHVSISYAVFCLKKKKTM